MVESKLSFLEMQEEGTLGQAIELGHLSHCIVSETFDPVVVLLTGSELIGATVNGETLVRANIYQPIISRPAIRIDNRSWIDVAPSKTLQYGLGAVRHDFSADHTQALEQPKDNRLAVGTSTSSISKKVGIKLGLIHFNRTLQRQSLCTGINQTVTYLHLNRIHGTKRYILHFCSHSCRRIHRKTLPQPAKFSLTDSRTAVVPVFSKNICKLY